MTAEAALDQVGFLAVADDSALEIVCGRCRTRLVRYPFDSRRPLEPQLERDVDGNPYCSTYVDDRSAVGYESPGSYLKASDGNWYRWQPSEEDRRLAEGRFRTRARFRCPPGCRWDAQRRQDEYDQDVLATVRALHGMGAPIVIQLSVDQLTRRASQLPGR